MEAWDAVRIAVGAIGAYLLLGGAEHYRRALLLAGFAAGAGLTADALTIRGPTAWAIAFLVGALAALLASLAERIAVALLGAALFATVGALAAPFVPLVEPWLVSVVGGVLGLFLMAPLYRLGLPLVTAGGGALLVAWALDRLDDPRVLVGAALVGVVVPWIRKRR
jgi:hypothetical protein